MSWGAADIIVLTLAGVAAYIVSDVFKDKKARGLLFSVVFFAANAIGRGAEAQIVAYYCDADRLAALITLIITSSLHVSRYPQALPL